MLLFMGSGCAALIYEIVWFQMLQLVIGSTAVSLGALLASFMGGMCLGSVALARVIAPRFHPLRVWAFLELGIGLLGLVVLFAVPQLANIYAANALGGFGGILLRAMLCAICLLPPTLLIGATLPAIARFAEMDTNGVSHLGLVYGANTLGAVVGTLVSGFYLLRLHDVSTATGVAAAINATIGIIALMVQVRAGDRRPLELCQPAKTSFANVCWPVYVTLAVSGLCALGAEVVWTRLLALSFGGTTYTFSITLAVFLLGLGIGNGTGAFLARRSLSPGRALGVCQLLLAGAIAWAACMLDRSLPLSSWLINPYLSRSIWISFEVDLLRCLWTMLPATCLWGASFPLALAAALRAEQDPARLVGRLYAANTIGAIVGAVGCSVLLVAWLGTQQTQRLLVVLSAVGGVIMIVPGFARAQVKGSLRCEFEQTRLTPTRAEFWLVTIGAVLLLAWAVPRIPWPVIAWGGLRPEGQLGKLLYVGEGMNASVAVTESDDGVRNFHVSGKIEASTLPRDMRLQRMLAHIPALFHPDPHSVLVVGCGAGVTAGSFLVHPGIQRINLCEIEPLIPKVVAHYFAEENYNVVDNPRVQLIYDDARHYILTARDKFDIITSDPIHPYVKGAASLYTKEYFELCKRHLNPGGMVTQWVPLYQSNLATVKSEIATFFEVFPDGTIWSNDMMDQGYDLVLLGQVGPLVVNVDALQQRLNRADHHRVSHSLYDVGFRSASSLVASYVGQACDLKPWLKSAEISRDRDLRLEYLAGLGVIFNHPDLIYSELSTYRRFPEKCFPGFQHVE
jgi:spermidine synthase